MKNLVILLLLFSFIVCLEQHAFAEGLNRTTANCNEAICGQPQKAKEYKNRAFVLKAEVQKLQKDPPESDLEKFLNGTEKRLNGIDRARIQIKKIHSH